jgi:hypothetical protein
VKDKGWRGKDLTGRTKKDFVKGLGYQGNHSFGKTLHLMHFCPIRTQFGQGIWEDHFKLAL